MTARTNRSTPEGTESAWLNSFRMDSERRASNHKSPLLKTGVGSFGSETKASHSGSLVATMMSTLTDSFVSSSLTGLSFADSSKRYKRRNVSSRFRGLWTRFCRKKSEFEKNDGGRTRNSITQESKHVSGGESRARCEKFPSRGARVSVERRRTWTCWPKASRSCKNERLWSRGEALRRNVPHRRQSLRRAERALPARGVECQMKRPDRLHRQDPIHHPGIVFGDRPHLRLVSRVVQGQPA